MLLNLNHWPLSYTQLLFWECLICTYNSKQNQDRIQERTFQKSWKWYFLKICQNRVYTPKQCLLGIILPKTVNSLQASYLKVSKKILTLRIYLLILFKEKKIPFSVFSEMYWGGESQFVPVVAVLYNAILYLLSI